MQKKEHTFPWSHFNPDDKKVLIELQAKAVNISDIDTLTRIYEMIQPKIVLGFSKNGSYSRVHEDSAKPMNILVRNYINNPYPEQIREQAANEDQL